MRNLRLWGVVFCVVVLFGIPVFAQEKVTIRWLFETDFGGGWKVLMERFEAMYPNIDVEMQEGPAATNVREDMYATSFMAGESTYDMAYADLIWIPKFAAAGWIIPLGDRLSPYEIAQFLPGDIAGGMYQGKLYRIPSQSDAGMLYYRKDLLEQAGFEPPRTWDDLVEQAQKLQNPPELWGFVWQGNQYEGLICDYLELLWGAGGELLDAEGKVVLDKGTAAVEALQFMYDVIHTYKISPPGVTTYQEEESRHVFHNGQAVFHRNWPYVWTLAQKEDSP
ncbi:MAG: extracellular solute-binding protein, partial [Candidatus Caldatribacterium sp.]|nr:extracellular solute-binding protein [Candidatus Caldatribacterium sp.]